MKRFYWLGFFILSAFMVVAAAGRKEVVSAFNKAVSSMSPPDDTAHGLVAYYYNDLTGHYPNGFDTLAFTRVDSTEYPYMNINWGYNSATSGSPDPRINKDWFSIRWVGLMEAPKTGNYQFLAYFADMVKIWVNGQLVLDDWNVNLCCANRYGKEVYLKKGQKYAFKIEYAATTGYAAFYLGVYIDGVHYTPPTSWFYAVIPRAVANPRVEPQTGLFEEKADVTLSTPTPRAVIHYTLDGSEPGLKSPVYDSTLEITSTVVFKAKAFADGMIPSQVITRKYTVIPKRVSKPVFYPTQGIYGEPVNLGISTTDDSSTIYYTLDGSNPDTTSLIYSDSIRIDSTTRVKAFAVKPGMSPSNITSATYTLLPPAAASPVFSVPGGNYSQPQQVEITSATPGAVIHYALNEGVLNDASPVYSSPIKIDKTTILKAYAEKGTLRTSEVTEATYTFSTKEIQVAAPEFSLPPGHYSAVKQVSITTDTKDADIYYTTDGSDPNENSSVFFAPILVNDSVTIKAYAAKPGMARSDIVSATYVTKKAVIDTGIIDDKLPASQLKIYPNPATDFVRISWDNMIYTLDGAYVTVTDSKGVVMKQVNIKGGYTYYDLHTNTFADGVYYIRVKSGSSTVYGKLIIGR